MNAFCRLRQKSQLCMCFFSVRLDGSRQCASIFSMNEAVGGVTFISTSLTSVSFHSDICAGIYHQCVVGVWGLTPKKKQKSAYYTQLKCSAWQIHAMYNAALLCSKNCTTVMDIIARTKQCYNHYTTPLAASKKKKHIRIWLPDKKTVCSRAILHSLIDHRFSSKCTLDCPYLPSLTPVGRKNESVDHRLNETTYVYSYKTWWRGSASQHCYSTSCA